MDTPSVLVVDDDAFARRTIRAILEGLSCNVTEAEDGVVASSKMEYRIFDLIVTDIFMPNQDGLETIRKIRSAHNDVCIIAISGKSDDCTVNFLKMAERIGADYAFPKPLDSMQLAGVVNSLPVRA